MYWFPAYLLGGIIHLLLLLLFHQKGHLLENEYDESL